MAEDDKKEEGKLIVLPGRGGPVAADGTPAKIISEVQDLLRQGAVAGVITITVLADGNFRLSWSAFDKDKLYVIIDRVAHAVKKLLYNDTPGP